VAEKFTCPECAGRRAHKHYECEPSWTENLGPWTVVLHRHVCAKCGYHIPSHLALRWKSRTMKAARAEWDRVYRPGAPRELRRAGFPMGA